MKKLRMIMIPLCLLLFAGECAGAAAVSPEKKQKADGSKTVIEIFSETDETEPETEKKPAEPEKTEQPPEAGLLRSPVTNEWVPAYLTRKRPVAVMYPIDKKAQPQYGLSRVSVFYEIMAESGMSRQMGIIEDYEGLSRIGNLRSIRKYFVQEALEWDAIIVHFGGPEVLVGEILKRADVDNLNGVGGVLGPDYGAFYRYPKNVTTTHNAYTDSEHLKKAIEKAGFATEHRSAYWKKDRWRFAGEEDPVELTEEQGAVSACEISMKGTYPVTRSSFSYNEEDGKYYRSIYGSPQKDALNGEQMCFDNILVQCTNSGDLGKEYLYFNMLAGGHRGWFMTRGRMIPVVWYKEGEYEVTRFYDAAGQEITLNTGRTMVCVAREGMDSFEADGVRYDL